MPSVGSGTMGIPSPIARPSPKDTPTRRPVKDPGPVATATCVKVRPTAMSRMTSRSPSERAGSRISARTSPVGSSSASAQTAEDVSTTKVTVRPDAPAVAAEMLDRDMRRVFDVDPLTPFDDHRTLLGQLLEPQVGQLGAVLDPVEIDVGKLDPARIDADELEGRACDRGARACPLGQSAHERGLAGAQLTRQQDNVARAQLLAKEH